MEEEAREIEKALLELDRLFLKGKEGRIYRVMLESLEKSLIQNTLKITFGNQLKAAKLLGINRNTLRSKIKKLGISLEQIKGERSQKNPCQIAFLKVSFYKIKHKMRKGFLFT